MIKVGITGTIASGKTFAANFFRELGAYIIDADKIGHSLYEVPEVKVELIEAFGTKILGKDETIDRKKLSELVFSSMDELEKLNEIMHPLINHQIRDKLDRFEQNGFPGVVVVDAALLGEWDVMKDMDYLLLIHSPSWHGVRRLIENRNLDEVTAEKRMKIQEPIVEKVTPYVDFIIRNPGQPDEFRRKLVKVWMHLKGIRAIE